MPSMARNYVGGSSTGRFFAEPKASHSIILPTTAVRTKGNYDGLETRCKLQPRALLRLRRPANALTRPHLMKLRNETTPPSPSDLHLTKLRNTGRLLSAVSARGILNRLCHRIQCEMTTNRKLLEQAYAAFNARDIDAALATMDVDVVWPNGMEGGNVYGHDGVRDYWLRQWSMIDPHVDPVRFETDENGCILAEVHQVVRNLAGDVIKDQMVRHAYVIEDGRIKSMDIRKP